MALSGCIARWAPVLLLVSALFTPALADELSKGTGKQDLPALPMPPEIRELIGLSPISVAGEDRHGDRLVRAALRHGLPPAIAQAVAFIESRNDSNAVGADGEIGLMQILPTTAAMLGHKGPLHELFEPETNIDYGVLYLAKAWRLASGDLCRALMKYRAGHGEERMSALSLRYCNRARAYLAAAAPSLLARQASAVGEEQSLPAPARNDPPRWMLPGRPGRPRTAEDSRRFWTAHEARIRLINVRLSARSRSG